MDDPKKALERDGFVTVRRCLQDASPWVDRLQRRLQTLQHETDPDVAVLQRRGELFAVRGLLDAWPDVALLLREMLETQPWVREVAGPDAGVVRSILFDKAPRASWFVPRHRDSTIAVKAVQQLPPGFSHPTRKHGVFHVEAPRRFMDQMLTVRIHLDPADAENGALKVVPGSHRGELADRDEQTLVVAAGDVVLMRPTLVHASSSTRTDRHRRVIHLEVAAHAALPPPLQWNSFHPLK